MLKWAHKYRELREVFPGKVSTLLERDLPEILVTNPLSWEMQELSRMVLDLRASRLQYLHWFKELFRNNRSKDEICRTEISRTWLWRKTAIKRQRLQQKRIRYLQKWGPSDRQHYDWPRARGSTARRRRCKTRAKILQSRWYHFGGLQVWIVLCWTLEHELWCQG